MSRAFKLSGVTFTATGLPSIYDPSFLAPNLVGWWAADQGLTVNGSNQVTNWNDLSGAGNSLGNPTAANSLVETLAGQNGLPVLSSPTASPTQGYWVQSAAAITALGFSLTTPFSINVVIKRQAAGVVNESLISNNPSAGFAGWQLMIGTNFGNVAQFRIQTTAGSSFSVHGSTVLSAGVAYVIGVTYDGSGTAAGIQIYVNGVAETMTIAINTATGAVANGLLEIGGWGATSNNFRDADFFCEAVIANVKITTAQIAQLTAYYRAKWGF